MSRTDKDTPYRIVGGRRRFYSSPPRWFVNHIWSGRERLAARVEADRARTEYRATGQVNTEPTTRQHHHGALWLWS